MARWQPPREQVVEVPKPPRWPMLLLLLALLGVAVAGLWIIRRQMRPQRPRPTSPKAVGTSARRSVGRRRFAPRGRGLAPDRAGVGRPADSVRVEVGLGDGARAVRVPRRRAPRSTDTLHTPRARPPARRSPATRARPRCRPAALPRALHALAIRPALGPGPGSAGGAGYGQSPRPSGSRGRRAARRSSGS